MQANKQCTKIEIYKKYTKKLVRLALALFSVSSLKDEKLIKNANLHKN